MLDICVIMALEIFKLLVREILTNRIYQFKPSLNFRSLSDKIIYY